MDDTLLSSNSPLHGWILSCFRPQRDERLHGQTFLWFVYGDYTTIDETRCYKPYDMDLDFSKHEMSYPSSSLCGEAPQFGV